MKKTDLKLLIENQRKIVVSLEYYFLASGYLPSKDEPLQYHLHNLWAITELIGESFDLDLISLPEIIKEGVLQNGINNMRNLGGKNDKNFVN
jgi:hypothetical protein